MTLGVGVGWLEEEFDAIGVPFNDRGKRLDDYVATMRGAVGRRQDLGAQSTFTVVRGLHLPAAPGARARCRSWSAGTARQRPGGPAGCGDGFFPGNGKVEELAGVYDLFRAACADVGRDPAEVELSAGGGGRSFDDIAQRVDELEALGVGRVVLSPLPGDQLDALAESLADRFGMTV